MKTYDSIYLLWAVGIGLSCVVLGIMGCVQPIPRPGSTTPPTPPGASLTPVPTAIPTPPATPPPTALAPTPPPTVRPPLQIRGPAEGSTVRGKAVVVHGIASPGSSVRVNGKPAPVDGAGRFVAELSLPEGPHQISVDAVDFLGKLVTQVVNVTVEPPQPFFLLVTEPKDQTVVSSRSIRLAGRTGLGALVSVNGESIGVDAEGAFTTTITLEPGPNIIDVVSTSPDGQVLAAVLAIIYRA